MNRPTVVALLVAALLAGGMAVPALALPTDGGSATGTTTGPSATAPTQSGQAAARVNVSVGPQLSTVIGVSSDEVQTEIENTAFELSVQDASEAARAQAIATRAEQLRDRAVAIREDYDEATAAYTNGDLTRSAYAQRLATLNARAIHLLDSYERLQQRAATVSALELRAAGADLATLEQAVERLRPLTGTGTAALRSRFTGESDGEIELETANGLSIEVEHEDGERSRELERPRDADNTISVRQAVALETARGALSAPETGRWVVTRSRIAADDGAFMFAFRLRNASGLTGEAEVSVDGSTGEVFALEEAIAPRDADDSEAADVGDDGDRELALVIDAGTPAPNATITVRVLANGAPVEGVPVSLNDRVVGTTDAEGRITVSLPAAGEVELTAQTDDSEGELEFDLGDAETTDAVAEALTVTATLDGSTVTTTIRYDGAGVEDATVAANGRAVGTTGADGTVTFTIDTSDTEELDLEITKGAFEAERTYLIEDGTLRLVADESENETPEDDSENETSDDDSEDDTDTSEDAD